MHFALLWVLFEGTMVNFKVWWFEVFAFNSVNSETDIWQNCELSRTLLASYITLVPVFMSQLIELSSLHTLKVQVN